MEKFHHLNLTDVISPDDTSYDKKDLKVTDPFTGKPITVKSLSEKGIQQYQQNQEMEKERENRKHVEKLKLNSLMNAKFKECRFENFKITPDNEKCFKLGRYYASHFDEFKDKNKGLLIYGEAGTGKSFLSFCIANYLIDRGVPVIACSFSTILEKIKEFSAFGSNKLNFFYNTLEDIDLLIIDDLGSEHSSEWIKAKIYTVIDLRYRSNKPLIITTNLDPDTELKRKLTGKDGITRTYDRIYEICPRVKMSCQPLRILEGNKKQAEFNQLFRDITGGKQ
ncbi:ATP-binding protein [Urinicoccus massiliensis]|uniref:ATP-binding protein n=1 Tax=Urinicoccus massiliensis TaxID=1723382 RepID=UPI00092FDD50|nr:ATP-binding protein [Urinicoccus massiliensis]